MAEKYVVGVDFGTLSGRAVVVRSTSRQSSGSCSAHEEPSRSPVSGSVRSITALG